MRFKFIHERLEIKRVPEIFRKFRSKKKHAVAFQVVATWSASRVTPSKCCICDATTEIVREWSVNVIVEWLKRARTWVGCRGLKRRTSMSVDCLKISVCWSIDGRRQKTTVTRVKSGGGTDKIIVRALPESTRFAGQKEAPAPCQETAAGGCEGRLPTASNCCSNTD